MADYIPDELLRAAQIRRVTTAEARGDCGIRYRSPHLAGLWYPNLDPVTAAVRGGRVRRDDPELEADGPIAKYVGPPARHYLYFPPGHGESLADTSVTVVIVEAEKSALALAAAASRPSRAPPDRHWWVLGMARRRGQNRDGTRCAHR